MSTSTRQLTADKATETVRARILVLRGRRVILDADLAELYDVETKRLNEAVKRNPDRFPDEFMFQCTLEELALLRSQIATSKHYSYFEMERRGGRRTRPYAFTEHGALMAASVLNSDKAIQMSVLIIRAFVRMREAISGYKEVAARLELVERKLETHDESIRSLVAVVRQLITPKEEKRKKIGFVKPDE